METTLLDKQEEEKQKKYFENIAEMLYENVKKPLNDNFISALIDKIIKEEQIEEYITQKRNTSLDTITLLYKTFSLEDSTYADLVPSENYFKEYYNYLYVTLLILKELEQCKLAKRNKEGIEKNIQDQIIKLCFLQYNKFKNLDNASISLLNKRSVSQIKSYEYNHRMLSYCFAPEKRYANISAYAAILEITELLELDKINTIHKLELCEILINPYLPLRAGEIPMFKGASHLPPTLMYLKKIGISNKEINKLEKESKDLDNITKLKLGLKIPDDSILKIRIEEDNLKRTL